MDGNSFCHPDTLKDTGKGPQYMKKLEKLGWIIKWNICTNQNQKHAYGFRITIQARSITQSWENWSGRQRARSKSHQ